MGRTTLDEHTTEVTGSIEGEEIAVLPIRLRTSVDDNVERRADVNFCKAASKPTTKQFDVFGQKLVVKLACCFHIHSDTTEFVLKLNGDHVVALRFAAAFTHRQMSELRALWPVFPLHNVYEYGTGIFATDLKETRDDIVMQRTLRHGAVLQDEKNKCGREAVSRKYTIKYG
jgi:hypothetical protein